MQHQVKKLFSLSTIALALACAACSTTEYKQAAAQPVDADGLPILTEQQKEAGVICKREPVTGTRISKKTCSTRAQREAAEQQAQRGTADTQRKSAAPTIFQ